MSSTIVIGAGQAANAFIAKLRALGDQRPITLIGEEPVPPYQRPPLSKAYLKGDMALERLYLRPEAWYAEQGVILRLGARAEAVDTGARTVRVGDATLPYDDLILTTGSVPRRLPVTIGGDLAGVHVVRSLADVDAMAPEMQPGRHVLVVGGGYIGLEAAAVAAT
ncbi:MAG: FAD-dependent oxidoreductase, partial [Pseudomonadota bacterium]